MATMKDVARIAGVSVPTLPPIGNDGARCSGGAGRSQQNHSKIIGERTGLDVQGRPHRSASLSNMDGASAPQTRRGR